MARTMGEIRPVYAQTTITTTPPTTTTSIGAKHLDEMSLKKSYARVQLNHRQMLVLCILAASLGSFCSGLFVGWSSHANAKLATKYNPENVARITSYLALGAAISPPLVHRLWPRIGTKAAMVASCLVMCTSIIGLFVEYGLVCRLAARFASGLAIGCIQLLMPAYVQDIVECVSMATTTAATTTTDPATADGDVEQKTSTTRPTTGTRVASMSAFASDVFHLQFVLGVLVMFVTGLFEPYLPHLGCFVLVGSTVALTIAACLLPESPRYLCQRCAEDDVDSARRILRKFVPNMDQLTADRGAGDERVAVERSLLAWSIPDESPLDIEAVVAGGTGIALNQLVGVIGALFYMEKLLALTYDASYTPAINAVLCALCLVAAASVPLFAPQWMVQRLRRCLVTATVLCATMLGLLGLHCHYRGTFGSFPWLPADDQTHWLPVLLFAAAFAAYGLGPMRLLLLWPLATDVGAVAAGARVPVRGHRLGVRAVWLAAGWLSVFGVVRILPGLMNAIGLGWLAWYMASNAAIAAAFLAWWTRRCGRQEAKRAAAAELEGDVMDEGKMGLVEKTELV